MKINNNLKTILNNRNLSVNDLSGWSAIKKERVNNILADNKGKKKEIKTIAKTLNVRIEDLRKNRKWLNSGVFLFLTRTIKKVLNWYNDFSIFFVLALFVTALIIASINIAFPYILGQEIQEKDVQVVSALSAMLFGLVGLMIGVRTMNLSNVQAFIINNQGKLYLCIKNYGSQREKRAYIMIDESTKREAIILKRRNKKSRIDLLKFELISISLSSEEEFNIYLCDADNLNQIGRNIRLKFNLIHGREQSSYDFILNSYVLKEILNSNHMIF